jgi:hypothetical protein
MSEQSAERGNVIASGGDATDTEIAGVELFGINEVRFPVVMSDSYFELLIGEGLVLEARSKIQLRNFGERGNVLCFTEPPREKQPEQKDAL